MAFKVKVVGQYYARPASGGKEKILRNYEFEANIPTLTAALSTVKNKLLDPFLSKKYPDYEGYRTYHITQITPLDEKSRQEMNRVEPMYMDRQSLVNYIVEHNLPVDSRLYPDLFKLRVAVQDAKTDVKSYLKKLERRRADLEMDLQIAKLNPAMQNQPETPPSVSIANQSKQETAVAAGTETPKKKDLSPRSLAKQTDQRVDGLRHDMIKSGEHGESTPETPGSELDDI